MSARDGLILSSQVIAEFIHVVSDAKRFVNPLDINTARNIAEKWWTAVEVKQVAADSGAMDQFFVWHRLHGLGRKRILDTLLAATYRAAGVNHILTTNAKDFTILGGFICITP